DAILRNKASAEALAAAVKKRVAKGPAAVVRGVIREIRGGRGARSGQAAAKAAAEAMRIIADRAGVERAWLAVEELDDALRKMDLASIITFGRVAVPSPVEHVVYRGRSLWVFTMEDGQWTLLREAAAVHTILCGPRDEVLASVPDEHFERVVMAAKR